MFDRARFSRLVAAPALLSLLFLCVPAGSATGSARIVAVVPLGMAPAAMAVDDARGRLFVAGDVAVHVTCRGCLDGYSTSPELRIVTIDSHTGAVIRTTIVPSLWGMPTAMVAAEPAGRVFVATFGGGSIAPQIAAIDAQTGALAGVIAPVRSVRALPPGSS